MSLIHIPASITSFLYLAALQGAGDFFPVLSWHSSKALELLIDSMVDKTPS